MILKENLERLKLNFKTNLQRQIIINQLEMVLYYFQQIEQTVTFLKLKTLNNFLLSRLDLKKLISHLEKLYPSFQIPNFRYVHSYFEIFKPSFHQEETDIYIRISIPIFKEQTFPLSLYHVIPVPIANITILPPHPYLVVDSHDDHQWMETLPEYVEDTFLISDNLAKKEECFINLLRRRPIDLCHITPIIYREPHVEQIAATEFIIIPTNSLLVAEYSCQQKTIAYKTLIQTTKITLTPNCHFSILNRTYYYEEPSMITSTFLLPNISIKTLSPGFSTSGISLKGLYQIQHQLNQLHPIHINEFEKTTETFKYLWIIISLCLILLVGFLLWIKKKPLKTQLAVYFDKRRETTSIQEPLTTEARSQGNVGSNPTNIPVSHPRLPF